MDDEAEVKPVPTTEEQPGFFKKVAGWLRAVMLTNEDLGVVRVVSENMSEEPVLVGDKYATDAIGGVAADPGRMTTAEQATVGNV